MVAVHNTVWVIEHRDRSVLHSHPPSFSPASHPGHRRAARSSIYLLYPVNEFVGVLTAFYDVKAKYRKWLEHDWRKVDSVVEPFAVKTKTCGSFPGSYSDAVPSTGQRDYIKIHIQPAAYSICGAFIIDPVILSANHWGLIMVRLRNDDTCIHVRTTYR
ncbi:hypothetical protein GQ600_3818 [Phytophthora cactorum]|nr:hypothetical protein GQ600_3818 [Phytophthora cactorum]